MRQVRSGVVLQGAYEPPLFGEMVAEIDALGFDHLWLTDSSLHARNPYAYLTLAATRSSRLTLGTAVTNPLTRHPAITAAAAATVDEISGGRMVLGIGAGDRPLLALGHGAGVGRLAPRLDRRVCGRSGAARTSTSRTSRSRFATRTCASPPAPTSRSSSPRAGRSTLELAGEIADGVILLVGPVPRGARVGTRARRPAERRGPAAIVRTSRSSRTASIDDDEDRALESARSIAAWFPQTAPVICELAGLTPSLVEDVRDAIRRRRVPGGRRRRAAAPR